MAQFKIGIIGLGYVGLPLARLFATRYPVVGFDINKDRVAQLNTGYDSTLEVSDEVLRKVLMPSPKNEQVAAVVGASNEPGFDENPQKRIGLYCSSNVGDIADYNIYIVTVPTPVDKNNRPNLTPLYQASKTVGQVLKKSGGLCSL